MRELANKEEEELIGSYLKQLRTQFEALDEKPFCRAADPKITMLPMSDGVKLYTVCFTPAQTGKFPTILMRSCYPAQEPAYRLTAEEYCKRGFAYVYQFCRGTGPSEGTWTPNVHDRADGKITADWLAGQDWVESIGYFGCSYLAFTGWIIADILPEKFETMYLTHYGTDRFVSAYQCGSFRQDILTSWAMGNAGFPISADYMQSVRYRPQIQVDTDLWGRKIDWYRDWITSTNRSDAYWQSGLWKELSEIPGKVKIPVYIGSGWYDHHLGSTLRTYEALSPESKACSVMRIGAWNHGFQPCVDGIDAKHLENSDVQSAFQWFDMVLRKKQIPQGCVRTYQIGADCWKESRSFPFQHRSDRVYYFSGASKTDGAYSLLSEPAETEPPVSYRYDPEHPVPSHGAESLLYTSNEIGSKEQPPCGWRDDVISFVSEPFQEDNSILGKITIRLYVSSSAKDTAFTAKVMEVRPNGKSYNIRSGITTLAYRKGPDAERESYPANSIAEAKIEMWDVSWLLHRGSRLRIDISSSDCPQYSVHTNQEGIWALQHSSIIAQQAIYTGKIHPSQVILPVE